MTTRAVQILSAYRDGPGCSFHVGLQITETAIALSEAYDYERRDSDGGAEWIYSVRTPRTSLPAVLTHFESLPGLRPAPAGGDPGDRLVHYIRELARTGELTTELGKQVVRDRVAAHFAAAGVPTELDTFNWMDMS